MISLQIISQKFSRSYKEAIESKRLEHDSYVVCRLKKLHAYDLILNKTIKFLSKLHHLRLETNEDMNNFISMQHIKHPLSTSHKIGII